MELERYQALADVGIKPEKANKVVDAMHCEIDKETSLKAVEYVKRSELHTELSDFATKSDLLAVKSDLQAVKSDLLAEMEKLQNSMIKWFFGTSISIVACVIASPRLFH